MAKNLQPAISSKTVSPIDRAALLSDAFALAKAGVASITSVFDILKGEQGTTAKSETTPILTHMHADTLTLTDAHTNTHTHIYIYAFFA